MDVDIVTVTAAVTVTTSYKDLVNSLFTFRTTAKILQNIFFLDKTHQNKKLLLYRQLPEMHNNRGKKL